MTWVADVAAALHFSHQNGIVHRDVKPANVMIDKSGAVKVTPKMRRVVTAMLFGVLALVLGNLIGSIFFGFNPLRDGGMLAIIFSLAVIALGAFTLLLDFDSADHMVRAGVPAEYAWGIALGLAVSIVWLYTEILRFLSYFNRN